MCSAFVIVKGLKDPDKKSKIQKGQQMMGKILKDKKTLIISLLGVLFAFGVLFCMIFYTAQNPAEKFEKQSVKKIKNVLETVVGKENVKVEVSAFYDLSNSQIVTENYQNAQNGFIKEIKEVSSKPGDIKKISVGIVVNKVLTPSQTREIEQLVVSTAGLDPLRGDSVTISGFKFSNPAKQASNNLLLLPLLAILLTGIGIIIYFLKKPTPIPQVYKTEPMELDFSNITDEPRENPDIVINPEKTQNLKGELKETISKDPKEAARLLSLFIKERI